MFTYILIINRLGNIIIRGGGIFNVTAIANVLYFFGLNLEHKRVVIPIETYLCAVRSIPIRIT